MSDIKVIDASRSVMDDYRARLRLVTDWSEFAVLTEQIDQDARLTMWERDELERFAESRAEALRPRGHGLKP